MGSGPTDRGVQRCRTPVRRPSATSSTSRSTSRNGRRRSMEGRRVCWPEHGRAELQGFEPRAPGPGEVLIESEVSLISPGTERAVFLGLPNAEGGFPSYPGYSNVGRVAALGGGVEG